MPDFLKAILPLIVKNVISITVGIGIFLLAYSFFGQLEIFREPWVSYVVLGFCVLLSVSASLIGKSILIFMVKIFKGILSMRQREQQRENEVRHQNRLWEEAVVSRVRALPTPIQFNFKTAGCNSFVVIGHDLIIIELCELGAVQVVSRTEAGLRIVVTDKGLATVKKYSSFIF